MGYKLQVRLTDAEIETLKEQAKAVNKPLPDYARYRLLGIERKRIARGKKKIVDMENKACTQK